MFSRNSLLELKEALSALLFPRTCTFCDERLSEAGDSLLCNACLESIHAVAPPFCEGCGLPLPGIIGEEARYCGRCLSDPPTYGRARYGVQYEGPVRDAMVKFKYSRALHMGRGLSVLLLDAFYRHFQQGDFDFIVPVPMHRRRLVQRGFNQAAVLAERISRRILTPIDRTSLIKTKDTPPQVGLPRSQRIKNLKNAFAVSHPEKIRDRRILLIDDVATTGSTVNECSRTLLKAKAASVDALVLALRLAPSPGSVQEVETDQS